MATDEERWEYRGEGNHSLVWGDAKEKKVYRLSKTPCIADVPQTHSLQHLKEKTDQVHCQLERIIDYARNVLEPLITSRFVPPMRLACQEVAIYSAIYQSLLSWVMTRIQSWRSYPISYQHDQDADCYGKQILVAIPPEFANEVENAVGAHRIAKHCRTAVDTAARSALVLPDLCFVYHSHDKPAYCQPVGPTFSIEIKPKKGFLSSSRHISWRNAIKHRVCSYCMHQRLKVKQGLWSQASKYCPVDLFSGNPLRINYALLELIKTPQNNLRICKDGKEIHGQSNMKDFGPNLKSFMHCCSDNASNGISTNSLNTFLSLIMQCLLSTDHCEKSNTNNKLPKTSKVCANSQSHFIGDSVDTCHSLPPMTVLERILSVQHLDEWDIEGIYPLYQQLQTHLVKHPTCMDVWNIDGPFSHKDWHSNCDTNHLNEDQATIEEAVLKVKRFLISKTVQDCSIMVALQRVNIGSCDPGKGILTDLHGCHFQYSVTIVDLDPKPFDKIPTYYKQDKAIVQAYKDSLELHKTNIES